MDDQAKSTYRARRFLVDYGGVDATTFVAGMGRSGTTWVADIVNYDDRHRILFEPFLPHEVEEARPFEYIQYLSPQDTDSARVKAARRILGGKIRHPWVDRENRRLLYGRRIVKDIRCNLMLGWLKAICPSMPIILVMRHPLAVAASWLRLGWGVALEGARDDFSLITAQANLLADFPEIDDLRHRIAPDNPFEKIIFEWCLFHWVPFKQFHVGEVILVFYENFLLTPQQAVADLFSGLKKQVDYEQVHPVLHTQSSTNFLNRDSSRAGDLRLTDWKETLSARQIERAGEILAMFSLDGLHDEAGHPTGQNLFQIPRAVVRNE
jgi:hypothetical protein